MADMRRVPAGRLEANTDVTLAAPPFVALPTSIPPRWHLRSANSRVQTQDRCQDEARAGPRCCGLRPLAARGAPARRPILPSETIGYWVRAATVRPTRL